MSRVVTTRIAEDEGPLLDLSAALSGRTVAEIAREALLDRVFRDLGLPPRLQPADEREDDS